MASTGGFCSLQSPAALDRTRQASYPLNRNFSYPYHLSRNWQKGKIIMTLHKDMQPAALEMLCQKTGMPAPVTEKVLSYTKTADFSAAEAFYPGLFSVDTGTAAVKGLRALFEREDENGLLILTVMLTAALRAREEFLQKGIPEKIWLDTMACFARFVRENFEATGVYSFDRDSWAYRQLSMRLFRLGELEYEMCAYAGAPIHTEGISLKEGDPILSLHIPSDARLSREGLAASYETAKAFFRKYYPDFHYGGGWCHSWIISPALKKLLPPQSKILTFQSDFVITSQDEDGDSYKQWLFKNPRLDVKDFPEDTSLQRRAKAHLLAGGKIGEAAGVLRPGLL